MYFVFGIHYTCIIFMYSSAYIPTSSSRSDSCSHRKKKRTTIRIPLRNFFVVRDVVLASGIYKSNGTCRGLNVPVLDYKIVNKLKYF